MFSKGQPNAWAHDKYAINVFSYHIYGILMILGRFISYVLSILPQSYSIYGGEFPFSRDLRDYQFDIGNSFHDCNHDRSPSMSIGLG